MGIAAALTEPLPALPSECRMLWPLIPEAEMVGQAQWSIIKRYEAMLWVFDGNTMSPGVINDRIRRCAAWYDRVREGRR